jgi:hypothetical protein
VTAIRVHATVDEDGEIRLRGLPLQRGQEAEIIVLTNADGDKVGADETLVAMLQHDPSWSWLRDPDEEVYTAEDVR